MKLIIEAVNKKRHGMVFQLRHRNLVLVSLSRHQKWPCGCYYLVEHVNKYGFAATVVTSRTDLLLKADTIDELSQEISFFPSNPQNLHLKKKKVFLHLEINIVETLTVHHPGFSWQ